MTRLQVLMPMGGLGSRFTAAGYTIPKPLIEVDGKPMFLRALDSFRVIEDVHHIFVIRKDQNDNYDLASNIRAKVPDADIAILEHDTRGAVESCLAAKNYIADNIPISIADCDIYFESTEYFQKATAANKPDGLLLTFDSHDPRYSYVKVSDRGKAIRTAEKIVISNHAILGGYYFSSGKLFKELALDFVSKPLPMGLKEYFMSHLFNILLEQDGNIDVAQVDTRFIFGTPEELQAYERAET